MPKATTVKGQKAKNVKATPTPKTNQGAFKGWQVLQQTHRWNERIHQNSNESRAVLRSDAALHEAAVVQLKNKNKTLENTVQSLTAELKRKGTALDALNQQHLIRGERVKLLEKRILDWEAKRHEEEKRNSAIRSALVLHVRQLGAALGRLDYIGQSTTQDCIKSKAAELVGLVTRLKSRSSMLSDALEKVEKDLRDANDALEEKEKDLRDANETLNVALAERDEREQQAIMHQNDLEAMKEIMLQFHESMGKALGVDQTRQFSVKNEPANE